LKEDASAVAAVGRSALLLVRGEVVEASWPVE